MTTTPRPTPERLAGIRAHLEGIFKAHSFWGGEPDATVLVVRDLLQELDSVCAERDQLKLVLAGELDVAALLAERERKLYVTLEEWCEAAMEKQGRSLDRESLNRVLAKRPLPKEDP